MEKQSEKTVMTGKQLIYAERQRQVEKEGWTIEHDDAHVNGELEKAADCYAEHAEINDYSDTKVPLDWPWDTKWWKPKNQIADYTRAGALFLAEWQRLERKGGAVGRALTRLRLGVHHSGLLIDELHRQVGASVTQATTQTSPRIKELEGEVSALRKALEDITNLSWKGQITEAYEIAQTALTQAKP